jgi:hypothetical protein
MLSMRWIAKLRAARASSATYQLAHVILVESFKFQQMAVKEIVLSKETTGLAKDARWRATRNLIKLGLIGVRKQEGMAVRVVDLYT